MSFNHQGLEALYLDGAQQGIQTAHIPKLLRILSALDVAQESVDVLIPGFRAQRVKGNFAGHWSIWVADNWRITYRFVQTDVELISYREYR